VTTVPIVASHEHRHSLDTSAIGFISFIQLVPERVGDSTVYPFSIPAVQALRERLPLHPRATFFVGDNGSGKSTILEAIAVAAGFNPEGGTTNFSFSTRSSESTLHRSIRLARTERRPRTGYFLRAESFFNVATNIEELDSVPALAPPVIDSYGSRSLHEQSHGEAFMALVRHRFGTDGLYILDEPDAALSMGTQGELLRALERLVTLNGSQIIVATHSLVLPALKDCTIYEFSAGGIKATPYQETETYRLARTFLDSQANES